jgi:precorrin-4/cobalt-precorrin-4 C11-methyltransferase
VKVYFTGAGPGDPDLLTCKAQRLIRGARCCVYAGSLISPDILSMLPENAEKYDSSTMTLKDIVRVFRSARKKRMDVIRLHSGEPAIYGAIAEQISELERLGIQYEIVPGISSFQASAAALGRELTVPEITQTVILTRPAGRTPVPLEQQLERLAPAKATLCVYLGAPQIERIASTLIHHYGPNCPAAVIYHATWPDQKIICGTLQTIACRVRKAGITRSALFLAGRALGPNPGRRSVLYRFPVRKTAKGKSF